MTNIKKIILKEIEKGNIYINNQFNILSLEQINKGFQKDYLKSLKDGNVSFMVSFEEYAQNRLDSEYILVSSILNLFREKCVTCDSVPDLNSPETEVTA